MNMSFVSHSPHHHASPVKNNLLSVLHPHQYHGLAKEVSIMDEKGNNIAFRKNLLIIGIDLITNSEKYGSCENFIKRIKKLHVN